MSDLVPCPTCRRHVASNATSCPFCEVVLAPPRACAGGCSHSPAERLARAAVVAAGAALLGASSCQSTSVMAPYGTPPHLEAGADAPQDAGAPADGAPDGNDAK
jgi:hypothetical protein